MQNKYNMAVITDAFKSFLNCKQTEDEDLIDYKSCFESNRDILLTQLGSPIIQLPQVAKADKDWSYTDKQKRDICLQRAHDWFEAYLFLENAFQAKYASLLKTLAEDFSLNDNRYPINLASSHKALQERKWDKSYQELKDKKKKTQQDKDRARQSQKDQEAAKAADETPDSLSFAQMENRCYCCGKKGHISMKCPQKDTKPKQDWAINKVATNKVQHLVTAASASTNATPSQAPAAALSSTAATQEGTAMPYDLMAVQLDSPTLQLSQFRDHLKGKILLDSASSAHVFCNPYLVDMHSIKIEDRGLHLETNGGGFSNKLTAMTPYCPERVWYNPDSVANILSLALLVRYQRVTFDSAVEDAFVVYTKSGLLKFNRITGNIYACEPTMSLSQFFTSITRPTMADPSSTAIEPAQAPSAGAFVSIQLLETVQENEAYYTNKQLARARQARAFIAAVGHPSIKDAHTILKINGIRDCPITEKDLKLMVKIYGPDVSALKGKITRTKQVQVKQSVVDIPKELIAAQKEIELAVDTIFVNGMPFLTTMSKGIRYQTAS
jgi:hypothetical protein